LTPALETATADRLLALRHEAWRVAVHALGPRAALAEDAVAEAYLHAVRHLAREPVRQLRTWFLRVVVNAARDMARSERARSSREATRGNIMNAGTQGERPDPALVAEVRAAIRGLEPRYRLPLVLRYESGLSQAEVAEVLDEPQGTVASQLKRGLEKLRAKLGSPRAGAAHAALTGAIGVGAALQAPASLLGTARAILASGALPAAKAGATASATAAGLFAAWKLLAAAATMVVLAFGAWKLWPDRTRTALPGGARPAQQTRQAAPRQPEPLRDVAAMLGREVEVRKGWMPFRDIFQLIHRRHGLRVSFSHRGLRGGVKLPVGRIKVKDLLQRVAVRCNQDLEVAVYRGGVAAFFWRRPEAGLMEKLASLASSKKEIDRCVAARWLPAAGSKRAWKLALSLLADPSQRVRSYARFGLREADSIAAIGFGYRADRLPRLAPAALGESLAAELKGIAQKREAGKPVALEDYMLVRLAGRIGHPDCLPPVTKILELELSRRSPVTRTRKTRGGTHGWTVSPRDPKQLRDGTLLNACSEALAGFSGPEAEKAIVAAFTRAEGLSRQHFFRALARVGKPATDELLLEIVRNAGKDDYLAHRALGALAATGRPRAIEGLLSLVERKKGPRFDQAMSQPLLRTGNPKVLAAAIAELRREKDAARRVTICWNICTATSGGEKIIPEIGELLGSPGKGRSRDATMVITALGFTASPRAVPLLEPLLQRQDRHVSSRAALALGSLGTSRAVDLLISALEKGKPDLKCSAAQALGETGDVRALPALRQAARSEQARLRMLALRSLGRLGDENDVPLLEAASKKPDLVPDPRTGKRRASPYKASRAALEALGLIGGDGAAAALGRAVAGGNGQALSILLRASDPAISRVLSRTMAGPEGHGIAAMLAAQTGYLSDRAALCDMVPALVARAERAGLPDPRRLHSGSCFHLGDPRQIEMMLRLLANHRDPAVRRRAAWNLIARGRNGNMLIEPLAARALFRAVREDPDPAVRAHILRKCYGLRLVAPGKSTRLLVDLAGSDSSPEVREAAVRVLPAGACLSAEVSRLRKLLASEKSAKVRAALKSVLQDWRKHTAEVLPEAPTRPRTERPEVF